MPAKWTIVVPARLQSTRLPRKPLADLNGKALIIRVLENLAPLQTDRCRVVAAVDDDSVLTIVRAFGFNGIMTSPQHESGTDRCLEAIKLLETNSALQVKPYKSEFIMNVQGDEPFVSIEDIKGLMAFTETSDLQMNTMFSQTRDMQTVLNPNVVKVLVRDSKAVYFSRAPIPFPRDYKEGAQAEESKEPYALHMGIYAFTRNGLEKFCALPRSSWEDTEKLEQLRWLQSGQDIGVLPCSKRTTGIDTLEDLIEARKILHQSGKF